MQDRKLKGKSERKNQLRDSENALNERCKKMQVNTRETYQFPYCDCIRKLWLLLAKSMKSVILSFIIIDYGDMTEVR